MEFVSPEGLRLDGRCPSRSMRGLCTLPWLLCFDREHIVHMQNAQAVPAPPPVPTSRLPPACLPPARLPLAPCLPPPPLQAP